MSGRILIIEGIATSGDTPACRLTEAGFDCLRGGGGAAALAQLPDPGIDLVFATAGARPDPALAGVLRALRKRQGCDRIPVMVAGHALTAPARLALLEAGADEVAEMPMGPGLLQSRIRNLMRARDTEDELARRAATHAMLGFSEAAAGFASRQNIGLIAPVDTVCDLPGVSGALQRLEPQQPFAAAGREMDLFVIEGAALRGRGHSPRELFHIVAELRSRSATRRAAQLVLLPEPGREAAMLLDLGADDVVPAGVLPEEIGHRARRLLSRKALADRLRATERHGLEAALTDPLTGLWNRRYAMPHLARLIGTARARARPMAVMLLDIDLFKAVNDRHGHAAGDRVLAQVADRLRDGLRPADLLSRIGGEEFLIAMPDTDRDQARGAAERLRRRIRERPFELPGTRMGAQVQYCNVTVSVGVALCSPDPGPTPEREAEAVMRRADAALYAAKETGRNRVTVNLGAA